VNAKAIDSNNATEVAVAYGERPLQEAFSEGVFSITLAMPCSFISLKIGIHQTNKDINTLIIVHVHMVLGFCLELSSLS
jgi:hypothetical protein